MNHVSKIYDRILYQTCPLCESSNFEMIQESDCSDHPSYSKQLPSSMIWNECKDCNHVFINGYFNDNALELIFNSTQSSQEVGNNIEINRPVSAKIIDKITQHKSKGIWLDVGFGNGSLLFTAQEYGFYPVGLDLRNKTVNDMKLSGIECYKSKIEDFNFDKKISVISMADVLEHTFYPKLSLSAAKSLLEKDGIIFLSMPNIDSVIFRIATQQNSNPYWKEIEHFHNFSKERLYKLLDEVGFIPLSYGISERYRMCKEIIAKVKN